MQTTTSPFSASSDLILAPRQRKEQRTLHLASILEEFQPLFRTARAGASLLDCVTYILHFLFFHWVLQILHRVLGFPPSACQIEEDGVMGGHSRRSKQSVKETSTVICDSGTTVEGWKQQIKVKDSIPANQQRLIFTSQRTVKQTVALAKLIPDRQWQIVVDASIEDIFKDLKRWRATLRSKNILAESLQPLVLRETDELASFLHSKTANDLRQIGVPCCVFFLSFKEWIPCQQTKESSSPNRELRGLDIKIDEEFRGNIFFIDLHGDLNGYPIPVPLRYVMNGSQLAAKLFMLEQTAKYREDQRQRHQQCLAPASKDSKAENSESSVEVKPRSSCDNYDLEIQQNCEFTAFISRDSHQLRCVVLPVITIPLVETNNCDQHPYAHLLSEELKNRPGQPTSNELALPSPSEIGETSSIAGESIDDEKHFGTTPIVTRKNTKKKRKKRSKKAAKENAAKCSHSEHDETGELVCSHQGPCMKNPQEEATGPAVNGLNLTNVIDAKKNLEDELPSLITKTLEPCSTKLIEDVKCLARPEVENKVITSRQSTCAHLLHEQQTCSSARMASRASEIRQDPGQKRESNYKVDHCGTESNIKRGKGFSKGPYVHIDALKVVDASGAKELSPTCMEEIDVHNCTDKNEYSEPSSVPECNPGTDGGLKVTQDVKKLEEHVHNRFQPESPSNLHRERTTHCSNNSSNFQIQRGDHPGSHMRTQQSNSIQKAVEGQYYSAHRKRVNQHFYSGFGSDDSRSSAPFWRHQREGTSISTNSWSKPKPLRSDNVERFPSVSAIRNTRNMPAWEQMPNLRHASKGSSSPINLENWSSVTSPWSVARGQSYNNFNMQQRKSGKSNKIPNWFPNRWNAQYIPHDQMDLNPNCSNQLSNTSKVHPNENTESTRVFYKSLDMEETKRFVQDPFGGAESASKVKAHERFSKEASKPCFAQCATNAHACSCEQDKSNLHSPSSQLAEHVHELLCAVDASYKSWVLYEQASSVNGNPICEFERVARAVAPTIRASSNNENQQEMDCLCEDLAKQIPDVKLSDFWNWYEEPSSYGVKVKLTESSKRTGNNFEAFFVPSLSAIQLFGRSGKRKVAKMRETTPPQGARKTDSEVLNEPILSILLPRPKASVDFCASKELFHRKEEGQYEGGSVQIVNNSLSRSKRECHCEVELLYEFFEQEKPQHRKPLINRINELVSRPELSSFGNAQLLNDAKIQELHPSSWFAVAWYPIYKIPDETFRSAFLTYHCLSCVQSMHLESANCMGHLIAAPMVGMMSYNAQVKEWFLSSDMKFNDILQQYLSNLATTATVMARGSLEKSSGFKHADFSFFHSRGR